MVEERHSDPELTQILLRMCQALAAIPRARVWEAAQRSEVVVSRTAPTSLVLEHVPFKQAFLDEEALGQALSECTPEVQAAAIALLADIDPDAAAGYLADLVQRDLSGYGVWSTEAGVGRAIGRVFQQLAPKLPQPQLADLWLSGRLRMSVVPIEAIQSIPIARIARAARESSSFDLDADRLLQMHDGFADAGAVLALLEDIAATGHFTLITRVIRRLGELRHAPAISILVRFLSGPDSRYHAWAMKALLAVETPEALAPLVDLLDTVDADDVRLPAAVEATIRLGPTSSFDRFLPSFTEASLATPKGLRVARAALSTDHALLVEDPRWLDLGVKLLADERLAARDMLAKYDEATLGEAVRRAGVEATRSAPGVATTSRWMDRYLNGEHEAVWDEICALGEAVRDPAFLPEARAVATEIMHRVRWNLESIVAVLQSKGYAFREGAERALVAPDLEIAKELDRVEALLGGPLPLAARAFHEVVGQVSLLEAVDAAYAEPSWFENYGAHEPLAIAPLSEVISALEQDASGETSYPTALRRRLNRLHLADDPAFKERPEDTGNDNPIYLDIRETGADATVELPQKPPKSRTVRTPSGAFRSVTDSLPPKERVGFVEYLRRYVRAGGFLWLADVPEEAVHRQRRALSEGALPF